MFALKPSPTTKRTHRRRSSSKATEKKDAPNDVKRVVSSDDLHITFENMISSISACRGESLDKQSVVQSIRSLYEWITFDRNCQLSLPVVPGSNTSSKMWPHGAVVDTRKQHPSKREEKGHMQLKELDEHAAIHVANSVVSSTFDDERSVKSRGEVIMYPSTGQILNHGGRTNEDYSAQRHQEHVSVPPTPSYAAAGYHMYTGHPAQEIPPLNYAPYHTTNRIVPEVAPRTMPTGPAGPRYSIMGGVPPPARVQETPDIPHAEPRTKVKGKKARVGTARREYANDDDGGVSVSFQD